ncbi:uncharacterized protein BDR25DRAFT_338564 [Lindgomyces ingoldianus]|uniref:Uncharacterized protein n=1 Tax=Lindgomyces ingoldianus TaxID=673940 RepID=A0ACB6REQ7_9PLEO|nr:uncharacterized protein BDR25DRAFT_338564 [Lindgomyces ingoldianus]KAF2477829.1 hypothetical protein BDR25DRAFT_338564 [Lindgomyces ingoldianus]
MSSTTARKPPPPGTPGRDSATRSSASPGIANRTPARAATPTSTPNGVQRTRSVRSSNTGTPVSARAAVRKPGAPSALSSQVDDGGDDAREEAAAYLQDLKERLQKAESEAEERQKQVDVLNSRLDDALKEQAQLEERAHEEEEKVEVLENEKRELTRQQREFEGIYEAERAQTMKDKEEAQAKEEEMQETIQRLKETMAMKNVQNSDGEEGHLSRTSSFRNNPSRNSSSQNLESSGQFAPPSSIQRSNSRNNSKLIHQKDKIIEGLRLELAEVQIKLVEMENAGGGRMQELEKQLLETRMTNARLMEDNESFQLLLSEKTLNGDLSRGDFLRHTSHPEERAPSRNGPSTSLADELESAEGADGDAIRRLEAEVNGLKDQNKALTLYINKIIGRLLTYQGFESVLGTDDAAEGLNTNKELPPPPPSKENEQPSLLQRAKSVAMGAGRNKPRPISQIQAPSGTSTSTVNEDPSTAPSIPLQRSQSVRMSSGSYSHRRSTSEWPNPAAANVVNNMYRNPPAAAAPGQTSPGLVSPRNSFFGIPIGANQASNAGSRVPSTGVSIQEEREGDSASSVEAPSPPRHTNTSAGGVMTGKQMRPLRLVQNEEEAMRARKAANRGSWIAGWFGGGEGKGEAGAGGPN